MPIPPVELETGRFHPDRLVLVGPAGEVRLSPIEGRLLAWLAARPDETHPYDRLLREVWGYRESVTSRTVYTTVLRLRRKIERDSESPRHVVSVPGLGYRFHPLRADARPAARLSGLPSERDAFFGRVDELAALDARLDAPGALVLVTGPAGSGKTRLAARAARRAAPGRPGGAVFVDLTAARSVDELIRQTAQALDVTLVEADARAVVGQALAGRGGCLMVLDNLEQLGAEALATVADWRATAPEATWLLTSRDHHGLDDADLLALEPLLAADAVALFVERARAAAPGFEPTEAEREWIGEIVGDLDGLPLAIELAAARLKVLSVEGVRARLRERFRLLGRPDGREGRHATMRAAIEWSWELLGPADRAALAQLSAFAGSFTLPAAEAVVDLSPWPDAPWLVDVIHGLADRSLIQVDRDRHPADGPWFRLLVSIREFAAERLRAEGDIPGASGPAAEAATWERHGRWYARHGTPEALAAWRRDPELERPRRLTADIDEVLLACRRALARGDGAVAVATAAAVQRLTENLGPFPLAVELTGAALAIAPEADRGEALVAYAAAWVAGGRLVEVEALTAEAIRLARERGEVWTEVRAHSVALLALHDAHGGEGVEDRARALVDFVRARGLQDLEGQALGRLGVVVNNLGRSAEALDLQVSAAELCRQVGDVAGEAVALSNVGNAHRALGNLPEAEAAYVAALAIYGRMGNRRRIAVVSSNLAGVYEVRGELDRAGEMYELAAREHREVGNRRSESITLYGLARLRIFQERFADAERAVARGLALARALGTTRMESVLLLMGGELELARGRPAEARAQAEAGHGIAVEVADQIQLGNALGVRGHARALTGELRAGLDDLDAGEALLARHGARVDRVVLLCRRARVRALAGDAAGAEADLAEVEAAADAITPAPSLLHQWHARTRAAVRGG